MYKDMTIIHGILECPLLNLGSKSEGRRAILTDDEGKKYKLYRAGILPAGDPFFIPYDGIHIGVSGNAEEETGSFLVTSILLDDGTEVFPQPTEIPVGDPIELPLRDYEQREILSGMWSARECRRTFLPGLRG